MEKYYIITIYYENRKIKTFEKKEEWLQAIDEEALDGFAPGTGESFTVGYITAENYELCTEYKRFNTFKRNKRGGYYYADQNSIFAKKIGSDEEEYIDIAEVEREEEEVHYYSIEECEEIDEEGNRVTVYYDEDGERYEDEDEAIELLKPSQYLTI